MSLTREQEQAICMHNNTVTAAGAGTGKTHTLVALYLKLIEKHGLKPGQIAALTFTDKAAANMKKRIRDAISERMNDDPGFWREHALGLENAVISTYNSFGNVILHTYAVRAGIDPFADTIDEAQARAMRGEAARAALDRAQKNDRDGCYERLLAVLRFEDPNSRFSIDLVDMVAREVGLSRTEGIRESLDCFGKESQEIIDDAFSELSDAFAELEAKGKKPERFAEFTEGAVVYEKLFSGVDVSDPKELRGCSEGLKRFAEFIKDFTGNEIKNFTDFRDKYLPYARNMVSSVLLLPVVGRLIDIVEDASGIYEQLKREHGVVDYNDHIRGVYNLLLEPVNADIVKELRSRYRFFIVDEFQDTNRYQSAIISILSDMPSNGANLFVVGDPKQAVYGFRGADVRAYLEFLRGILAVKGDERTLSKSFRSVPQVIDFSNTLFFENLDPCSEIFDPRYRLSAARTDENGAVRLFYNDAAVSDPARFEAETVGAEIRRLVSEGKFGYSDCALLARKNDVLDGFCPVFSRLGIPFSFSGGRGFYASQEIDGLMQGLRFIVRRRDRAALASFMCSIVCGLARSDCAVLDTEEDFLSLTGLPEKLERVRAKLSCLCRDHVFNTVDEVVVNMISAFDLACVLLALPDGRARLANVMKFIEKARDFARAGQGSLRDFVDMIDRAVSGGEDEGRAVVASENVDAVRFMTMHGAKGLEFPVVFLVGLGKKPGTNPPNIGLVRGEPGKELFWLRPTGEQLFYDSEARELCRQLDTEESLRLFYVAVTRARDFLYLSGDPVSKSDTDSFRAMVDKYADAGNPVERVRCKSVISSAPEFKPIEGRIQERLDIVNGFDGFAAADPFSGRAVYLHRTPSQKIDSDDMTVEDAEGGEKTFSDAADSLPDYAARGTVGHKVLELLPAGADPDFDFMRLCPDDFAVLSDGDRDFVLRCCRNYVGSDSYRAEFEREYRELAFCRKYEDSDGALVFVEGKIDRLCVDREGRAHIFDYKFSRFPNDEYREQMNEYRRAVEDAGYEVASCAVLYLGGDAVAVESV